MCCMYLLQSQSLVVVLWIHPQVGDLHTSSAPWWHQECILFAPTEPETYKQRLLTGDCIHTDPRYNTTELCLPLFSPHRGLWWTLVPYSPAFLSACMSSWLHKGKRSYSTRRHKTIIYNEPWHFFERQEGIHPGHHLYVGQVALSELLQHS